MLAFSVREALRQAAAAFGPPGTSVDLASPATPEAVYWAVEQARRAAEHGHVDEGAPASSPTSPTPQAPRMEPDSERVAAQPDPDLMGHGWSGWRRSSALRGARQAGVLVTLAAVRGHAPREAGAKMVVAADRDLGHDRRRQPRGRRDRHGPGS